MLTQMKCVRQRGSPCSVSNVFSLYPPRAEATTWPVLPNELRPHYALELYFPRACFPQVCSPKWLLGNVQNNKTIRRLLFHTLPVNCLLIGN